jgi:hypothetical protein
LWRIGRMLEFDRPTTRPDLNSGPFLKNFSRGFLY